MSILTLSVGKVNSDVIQFGLGTLHACSTNLLAVSGCLTPRACLLPSRIFFWQFYQPHNGTGTRLAQSLPVSRP